MLSTQTEQKGKDEAKNRQNAYDYIWTFFYNKYKMKLTNPELDEIALHVTYFKELFNKGKNGEKENY